MKFQANLVVWLLMPWLALPVDCMQAAPWLGTWRQNSSEPARWYESPAYKTVTSRLEIAGDGIRVVYDMVKTRGGVAHMEWTGKFDGRDYLMQGVDYVMTNAYRLIDDRSYEIVIKVDGRHVATAVAVVAADGRTMTVTTTERDARGNDVKSVVTYARVEDAK